MVGQGMVRAAQVGAVVIALMAGLGACGDGDNSEPASSPSPEPSESATPAPTVSAAISPLVNTATANTAATTPSTGLSSEEFDRALRSLSNLSTPAGQVANALNDVNPEWDVLAGDLDEFARRACDVSVSSAWELLRSRVPGADLSAMPALNQAILLVPGRCVITNQAALDRLSNVVVIYVLSNEPDPVAAIPDTPAPPPAPSPTSDNLYKGLCAALSTGLGAWTKSKISSSEGGGVLLAMTIAGGMVYCPDTLKSALE